MLKSTLEVFSGDFKNIFMWKKSLSGSVSWELRAGIHWSPQAEIPILLVSSKPRSFVIDPGDSSLFLWGASLALRLAHGNTWISSRRDIKDGYSCIMHIIVCMTKSTEFIHSQDVSFLTLSRWEAEKVFYWSSAKLQNQVHPEDKFSIRLAVFQPEDWPLNP